MRAETRRPAFLLALLAALLAALLGACEYIGTAETVEASTHDLGTGDRETEEVDIVVHAGRTSIVVLSATVQETFQSCLDDEEQERSRLQLVLTPARDCTLGDGTTEWTLEADETYCIVVTGLRGGSEVEVRGRVDGGTALAGSLLPDVTRKWLTAPVLMPIEILTSYEDDVTPAQVRLKISSPQREIELVLVEA